ncbi:MAG: hypothetical protein Q9216_005521 [Gyalolechia sp. 2 TL-2023]
MASPADSLTPASIVFPTLSLIAILLDVPPLVWHVRNRNVAACNLISWTIFANLCNTVNALIWPTDNISTWFPGYVLCDIEAKLLLAATIGISGSLVCIMRALAKVLDTNNTIMGSTKKQRYRELTITALLCFGGPIYIIPVHYVVQPTRYYIIAIAGCTTSIDNSWPAIVLVIIWPIALCLAATYYGLLVMFRMRKYRREFSSVLTASNSRLTQSRFLRLFLLSFLLVLIFLPFQLYQFYLNVSGPLLPYSWDLVHGPAWMDIIMVPQHGVVPLDRWITIVLGILVFLFFGLGSDATKMYRKCWLRLRLGAHSPGLYGQSTTPHAQSASIDREDGSLTSLFLDFCRNRLSSRRSATSQSEKRNTVTTISTLASPIEAEKMSQAQDSASLTSPTDGSHSPITSSDDMPLPPVPAQSKPSWLKKYMARGWESSPADDIESALQRHEDHRPNRFITGLWHVNNTVNAGRAPAAPGICTGNCNGLKG